MSLRACVRAGALAGVGSTGRAVLANVTCIGDGAYMTVARSNDVNAGR